MKRQLTVILLGMLLVVPSLARAQVIEERLDMPGQRVQSGLNIQSDGLQERHFTDVLLNSEEGQEARRLYRQMKESGQLVNLERSPASAVGETRVFHVIVPEETTGSNAVYRDVEFTLRRIGINSEIWVESSEYGPGKVTEGVLDQMLDGLEENTPAESVDPELGIIELMRSIFTDPEDDDVVYRPLKILITDIQDGWSPDVGGTFIAGLFNPVDLVDSTRNENSNFDDIVYINSNPGIYRDDVDVEPTARLHTLAHEYQHVIHGKYDGLDTFQNEGQSGVAEILAGFSARTMSFLNNPSELTGQLEGNSQWLYRWRSGSNAVNFDYQRSQLFHSYFEERLGTDAVGELTRSVQRTPRENAYRDILEREGLTLPGFISDFYVSSYRNGNIQAVNDIGFSRPQFDNLRVSFPGTFFNLQVKPWVFNREQRIFYGGANYTQWFGVEDFMIDITRSAGIRQTLLYRRLGEINFSVMQIGEGVTELSDGLYEEIVLVSVNVENTGQMATPDDSRTYTYSGEWTTTDLALEDLAYFSEPDFFFPLPEVREDGSILYSFASRISPEFDSGIQNIWFSINNHDAAISGEGELVIALFNATEATINPGNGEEPIELYIPDDGGSSPIPVLAPIAFQQIPVEVLSPGFNYLWVDSEEWQVEGGEEYFIVLAFNGNTEDAYMEFLLDSGSVNEDDPDYYPPRTLVGFLDNGAHIGWGFFPRAENQQTGELINAGNNNLVFGTTLIGYRDIGIPNFPAPPVSQQFSVLSNYPNPFSATTEVEYNIPEEADIRITIHDALGRQVQELFNGTSTQGLHTVRFNASSLASGVYYFRMIHPGGASTRSMMHIRN